MSNLVVARMRDTVTVVLGQSASSSSSPTLLQKVGGMYKGVKFAYVYKTIQRSFQYTVQPKLAEHIEANHRPVFVLLFGSRNAKPVEHAVAGCLMGCSEIIFLPIDSLKVKAQTSSLPGFNIVSKDSCHSMLRKMYRGASWAAARNGLGAFTLFGGAAFTKEHVLGLRDYQRATAYQHFLSSTVASALAIWLCSPLDLMKTRVQRGGQSSCVNDLPTGLSIARALVKEEGWFAFFKGSAPKVACAAPKLMFTYTIANWLSMYFARI